MVFWMHPVVVSPCACLRRFRRFHGVVAVIGGCSGFSGCFRYYSLFPMLIRCNSFNGDCSVLVIMPRTNGDAYCTSIRSRSFIGIFTNARFLEWIFRNSPKGSLCLSISLLLQFLADASGYTILLFEIFIIHCYLWANGKFHVPKFINHSSIAFCISDARITIQGISNERSFVLINPDVFSNCTMRVFMFSEMF